MKTKVLLVEANVELQEILEHALKSAGFDITIIDSIEKTDNGFVYAESEIILFDNDLQSTTRLSQFVDFAAKSCTVVILSSDFRLGASYPNVIMKPVSLPMLVKKLKSILEAI